MRDTSARYRGAHGVFCSQVEGVEGVRLSICSASVIGCRHEHDLFFFMDFIKEPPGLFMPVVVVPLWGSQALEHPLL